MGRIPAHSSKIRGLNRAMFTGGGEALTHKHAPEAIALTKKYVPTVILHSNGVFNPRATSAEVSPKWT